VEPILRRNAKVIFEAQYTQGKTEGKRPLGRPRPRWQDNIEMDLQEEGCGCMDFIDFAQDRNRRRALIKAQINFLFHKLRGISVLAENRLASEEGFCYVE
jgi:hypothetical protein